MAANVELKPSSSDPRPSLPVPETEAEAAKFRACLLYGLMSYADGGNYTAATFDSQDRATVTASRLIRCRKEWVTGAERQSNECWYRVHVLTGRVECQWVGKVNGAVPSEWMQCDKVAPVAVPHVASLMAEAEKERNNG